jgi:hypothetical protein
MKAKFLAVVTAIAIASTFAPTSAFSRGSEAAQERKECDNKCNATGAPPTPQIQACYNKCGTKPDSKTTK